MQPSPTAQALSEQLLLLTLATEQSMVAEDWVEVDVLMARRESILDSLESLPMTPDAKTMLDQVQRLESALMGRLHAQRSNIIGQMIQERRQTSAAAAYRKAG